MTAVCFREVTNSKPGVAWLPALITAWEQAKADYEAESGVALELSLTPEYAANVMIKRFRTRNHRTRWEIFARMHQNKELFLRLGSMTVEAREANEEWRLVRNCMAATIMGPLAVLPTEYHKEKVSSILKKFVKQMPAAHEPYMVNNFEKKIINYISTRMRSFVAVAALSTPDVEEDHDHHMDLLDN